MQNGIGNYGYAGTVDLLVPIAAPKELAAGQTAVLDAEASWLACADICIPGGAKLGLKLPVAAQPPPPILPLRRCLRPPAGICRCRRRSRPALRPMRDDFRLLVPSSAIGELRNPTGMFFPIKESLIDAAADPRIERHGDGLAIVLPKASDGHGRAGDPRWRARPCAARTAPNAPLKSAPTPFRGCRPKAASSGGRRCCWRFSAVSCSTRCPASSQSFP